MCRKYHFDEKVYLEVTEERLNIIRIAYKKCGSYCSFGRALGIAPQNVRELLNGNRKSISQYKWEKVRLIAAKGNY